MTMILLMMIMISVQGLEIQESMSDLSRIPWKPVLTSRSSLNDLSHSNRNHANRLVQYHHHRPLNRLEVPIDSNLRLVLDAKESYAAPLPSNNQINNNNNYRVGFIRASDLDSVLRRNPPSSLASFPLPAPTLSSPTPVFVSPSTPDNFSPMILKYSQPISVNNEVEASEAVIPSTSIDNNNSSSTLLSSPSKTSENFLAKNPQKIFPRKQNNRKEKKTKKNNSGKIRETTTTAATTTSSTTTTTETSNQLQQQQQQIQEELPIQELMMIEQQKQTSDEMNSEEEEEDAEQEVAKKIRDEVQRKVAREVSRKPQQQQQQVIQEKDDVQEEDVQVNQQRIQEEEQQQQQLPQQAIKGNIVLKKKSANLRMMNESKNKTLEEDSSEEEDNGFGDKEEVSRLTKSNPSSSLCSMSESFPSFPSLKEASSSLEAEDFLIKFPSFERIISKQEEVKAVFLPSNDALSRLPRSLLKKLQEEEEQQDFLENHVSSREGRTLKDSVLSMRFPNSNGMTTVNGVRVSRATRVKGIKVFVIEGVLYPLSDKDVMETLKACNRFDGFVTLAEGTGLGDRLRDETSSFTVFVPSNEALQKIPDEDLNRIRNNMTSLREFLSYHVSSGSFFSSDLKDGQFIPSLNDNQDIQVGVRVDSCRRRVVESNVSPVYRSDIPAKNGVIHVIDWILKPSDRDWFEGIDLPRRRRR